MEIRRGRIETEKPIVLTKGQIDFTLPEGHTLHLSDDGASASLHAVGTGGGTYEIIAVHDEGEEIRIVLGDFLAGSALGEATPAYAFPTRDAVDLQLRRRWIDSGGDPDFPDQPDAADGWREHARKLRAGIRARGGRA